MNKLSNDAALLIGDFMVRIDEAKADKTTEKLLEVCRKFTAYCEKNEKDKPVAKDVIEASKESEKYLEDAIANNVSYQQIYKVVHEYYSSSTFEMVR